MLFGLPAKHSDQPESSRLHPKRQMRGKLWIDNATNSLNFAPLRISRYAVSPRELPYVKERATKYKDTGLFVIGVDSPEFSFAKNPTNVRNAVAELRIHFPVPIDSKHSIWSLLQCAKCFDPSEAGCLRLMCILDPGVEVFPFTFG